MCVEGGREGERERERERERDCKNVILLYHNDGLHLGYIQVLTSRLFCLFMFSKLIKCIDTVFQCVHVWKSLSDLSI